MAYAQNYLGFYTSQYGEKSSTYPSLWVIYFFQKSTMFTRWSLEAKNHREKTVLFVQILSVILLKNFSCVWNSFINLLFNLSFSLHQYCRRLYWWTLLNHTWDHHYSLKEVEQLVGAFQNVTCFSSEGTTRCTWGNTVMFFSHKNRIERGKNTALRSLRERLCKAQDKYFKCLSILF